MNADGEFAQALAAALGPMYHVSVVLPDGTIEMTFHASEGPAVPVTKIGLPSSTASLLVELDVAALQAADHVLHSLARAPVETSIGLRSLDHALESLITAGEAWVGRPVSQMSRLEKQRLVKFLDERGAFSLRKSVETVADVLGVSRFTVYNYLDASRGP